MTAVQTYERMVAENLHQPGKHSTADLAPFLAAARAELGL